MTLGNRPPANLTQTGPDNLAKAIGTVSNESHHEKARTRQARVRAMGIACLMVAASLGIGSTSALAAESPLLSGYGGPGAGEQHVIGSTLIGGGGSGGGDSSTGSGDASPAAGEEPESDSAGASAGGSASRPAAGTARGHAGSGGKSKAALGAAAKRGGKPKGGAGASSQGSSSATSRGASRTGAAVSAAGSSVTLGLSGSQLLLVVLAAFALALVAIATWRLARRSPVHAARDDDGLGLPIS